MAADIAILLHSHMPYVRRNGDWPVGEIWILEAWAESYLPTWELIGDLTAGTLKGKLALTLTPVLAEQLRDDYLQELLKGYLENRILQAREEVRRLRGMGDEARARLAASFADNLHRLLRVFEERFRGRMIEVLEEGMEAGVLEVLASAATHAHLPSLGSDTFKRAQIGIGLEEYRRCFDRDPAGFWLPECSYTPDLDTVLAGFSPPLRYVILDHTAPESAPGNAVTWEPGRLGATPIVALMRDRLAHDLVWTPQGYPSGGAYRDYSKRDHEGHGFQYWRITSTQTPLDEKDLYDPLRVADRARADALDFVAKLRGRIEEINSQSGHQAATPFILAAYDTELLGHWWLEGPLWLREVLALLGAETVLPLNFAALSHAESLPVISPSCTAWNVDGTFSTWVGPATADIWDKTHLSENEFERLLAESEGRPPYRRALMQAARELLLMEGSDWSFMITRDQASSYARDRFEAHRERFSAIASMLERGEIDTEILASLEEVDNIFPWLDLDFWT
jgi:1,4-alpha-glucan branching enzyme